MNLNELITSLTDFRDSHYDAGTAPVVLEDGRALELTCVHLGLDGKADKIIVGHGEDD